MPVRNSVPKLTPGFPSRHGGGKTKLWKIWRTETLVTYLQNLGVLHLVLIVVCLDLQSMSLPSFQKHSF